MFKQTEFSDQAVKKNRKLYEVSQPKQTFEVNEQDEEKNRPQEKMIETIESLSKENENLRQRISELKSQISVLENIPFKEEIRQVQNIFVDVEEHILNPDSTAGKLYSR